MASNLERQARFPKKARTRANRVERIFQVRRERSTRADNSSGRKTRRKLPRLMDRQVVNHRRHTLLRKFS